MSVLGFYVGIIMCVHRRCDLLAPVGLQLLAGHMYTATTIQQCGEICP